MTGIAITYPDTPNTNTPFKSIPCDRFFKNGSNVLCYKIDHQTWIEFGMNTGIIFCKTVRASGEPEISAMYASDSSIHITLNHN